MKSTTILLVTLVITSLHGAVLDDISTLTRGAKGILKPTASDTVARGNDDIIIVATLDGSIYGIRESTGITPPLEMPHLMTGEKIWNLDTDNPLFTSGSDSSDSSQVIPYDEVTKEPHHSRFIPSIDGDSSLYALSERGIQKLPISIKQMVDASPFWNNDLMYIGSKETHMIAINSNTGELINIFSPKSSEIMASSCPMEGTVFIGRTDYSIQVIDSTTGKQRWNVSLGEYTTVSPHSSDRASSDLLTSNMDGSLSFKDPSSKNSWKFTPPSRAIFAHSTSRGDIFGKGDQKKPKDSKDNLSKSVVIGTTEEGQFFAVERVMVPENTPTLMLPSPNDIEGEENSNSLSPFPARFENLLLVDTRDYDPEQFNFLTQIDLRSTRTNLSVTNDVKAIPENSKNLIAVAVVLSIGSVLVALTLRFSSIRKIEEPIAPKMKKKKTKKKSQNAESSTDISSDNPSETSGKISSDGVQIGKLHVTTRVLGYGSMGTIVFEGDLAGRKVAVKRMLAAFFKMADKERDILLESDHNDYVVTYYAKEEDKEFVYLALTYCPRSLVDLIEGSQQHIGEGEFPSIEAVVRPGVDGATLDYQERIDLCLQIANGLAHLHGLKIVHRDLKPHNILIDSKDKARISDMGVAKKLDSMEHSFTAHVMSGSYQAPEILRAREDHRENMESFRKDENFRVTQKIDIFSLGCVFYYILTEGKHPFGDRLEHESRILKNDANLSEITSHPEAVDLIEHMTQFDPSDRPDIQGVIHHPFFWSPKQRLNFLKDASDRLEIEKPTSDLVIQLERDASKVIGRDWKAALSAELIDNLGKYRKYDETCVRDLLRVMRNKISHYHDLPEELKAELGSLPEGYLLYFSIRFPKLLIYVYRLIEENCSSESLFHHYFNT